jgi:hypothetical protein
MRPVMLAAFVIAILAGTSFAVAIDAANEEALKELGEGADKGPPPKKLTPAECKELVRKALDSVVADKKGKLTPLERERWDSLLAEDTKDCDEGVGAGQR